MWLWVCDNNVTGITLTRHAANFRSDFHRPAEHSIQNTAFIPIPLLVPFLEEMDFKP